MKLNNKFLYLSLINIINIIIFTNLIIFNIFQSNRRIYF